MTGVARAAALAVGASLTCTGTYALKNNDINSRSVNNSATATALYNGYTVTSNVATASVPVPPMLLEFVLTYAHHLSRASAARSTTSTCSPTANGEPRTTL